jgi:chromate reductase
MRLDPLRIGVIIGSVRDGSNTAKAAAIVVAELLSLPGVTVDVIDPRQMALAIPGAPGQQVAAQRLTQELQGRFEHVHGVVMLTPEYDGSYSAVLKLMIEYLGYPSVLAGKSVAILGVAAGRIGALRALEHLRSLLVHIGALVVPTPKSVAEAHKVFDAQGQVQDKHADGLMRGVARDLVEFVRRRDPSLCSG